VTWLLLAILTAIVVFLLRDDVAVDPVGAPVGLVDSFDPWDDYVMGLGPGDVIVTPHGVEVELIEGWSADDVVSLLAELDRWPEIEAA
jgi:hypothetical protein